MTLCAFGTCLCREPRWQTTPPTMKHSVVCSALLFAVAFCFNSLTPAATSTAANKAVPSKQDREKRRAERKVTEDEVLQVNKKLHAALVRGDVNALTPLLAAEYT